MDDFYYMIANKAQKAIMYEALLSPKPGLVDRIDSGSHTDMDIFTFVDSSLVLGGYFYKCARVGYENKIDQIMDIIRPLGIVAEADMYQETSGVNVHKGVIFLYGILCAASGYLKSKQIPLTYDGLLGSGKQIAGNILDDFKDKEMAKTYGQDQYSKYGLRGIRGEVYDGFPSVKKAYTYFEKNIKSTNDLLESMGNTLVYLMTFVYDTNIIARGGMEGLEFMRHLSQDILNSGAYSTEDGLEKLTQANEKFIQKNISPGGCADLCSLVVFIYFLKNS